jgi:hypothetical protein
MVTKNKERMTLQCNNGNAAINNCANRVRIGCTTIIDGSSRGIKNCNPAIQHGCQLSEECQLGNQE